MKSSRRGKRTLGVEVTNVSAHGFWILIGARELFVSFEQFPFFQNASIMQILEVERRSPDHLYWPDLDVDLAIESVEHPERFPLISRARARKSRGPARRSPHSGAKRARFSPDRT